MKAPKENLYDKHIGYKPLRDLLKEKGKSDQEIDLIYKKGIENIIELQAQYQSASKGEKKHLARTILTRIAIYRSLREVFSLEETVAILDKTVRISCTAIGEKIYKITSFPLMRGLFMKLFASMIKKSFGASSGFEQIFYEGTSKKLRLDVLKCPYERVARECEASEIAHTFCDSDVYCYGKISQIKFDRTSTLAKGGKRCDFDFHYVKK